MAWILHTPYPRVPAEFVSERWVPQARLKVSEGTQYGQQAVCTGDPLWQLRSIVLVGGFAGRVH